MVQSGQTGEQNKQENPVADKRPPPTPTSNRPVSPLSPCLTEDSWSKSQFNYVHSSIYKNIPSTLLHVTAEQNRKKTKKAETPRGASISVCLCHRCDLCLPRVAPCSVSSWRDHLCTNTAGPTALLQYLQVTRATYCNVGGTCCRDATLV